MTQPHRLLMWQSYASCLALKSIWGHDSGKVVKTVASEQEEFQFTGRPGVFLCGLCVFSPHLGGFSTGNLASSKVLQLIVDSKVSERMWVRMVVCSNELVTLCIWVHWREPEWYGVEVKPRWQKPHRIRSLNSSFFPWVSKAVCWYTFRLILNMKYLPLSDSLCCK